LNEPDVQDRLGADPGARNFSILSYEVAELFVGNNDMWSFDTGHYVEALLERGVRTLYFNGNQDAVCNWRGTERWLDELEWTCRQEFNEARREDWVVDNKPAGWKRRPRSHLSWLSPTCEEQAILYAQSVSIPEKSAIDPAFGTPPRAQSMMDKQVEVYTLGKRWLANEEL